jgi:hypothetical protein
MLGSLGPLTMLPRVCVCLYVFTHGCACMRECALLLIEVLRATWHLLATTRMLVGVAMASRHAGVPRNTPCAFWSAHVRARVAARACVRAFLDDTVHAFQLALAGQRVVVWGACCVHT